MKKNTTMVFKKGYPREDRPNRHDRNQENWTPESRNQERRNQERRDQENQSREDRDPGWDLVERNTEVYNRQLEAYKRLCALLASHENPSAREVANLEIMCRLLQRQHDEITSFEQRVIDRERQSSSTGDTSGRRSHRRGGHRGEGRHSSRR